MKKLLFVLLSFTLMAMTCKQVQRDTSSMETKTDSTAISVLKSSYDSLYKEHTEALYKIKKLNNTIINFRPPVVDTAAIKKMFKNSGCSDKTVDSVIGVLSKANATIKKLSNGNVELTGVIDQISMSNELLESKVEIIQKSGNVQKKMADSLYTLLEEERKTKEKHVEKKPAYGPVAILLTIGIVSILMFIWGFTAGRKSKDK